MLELAHINQMPVIPLLPRGQMSVIPLLPRGFHLTILHLQESAEVVSAEVVREVVRDN